MGEIQGLFHADGNPLQRADLEWLEGAAGKDPAAFDECYASHPTAARPDVSVSLDGRLYNTEDLLNSLRLVDRNPTEAALVLAAFERWGSTFVRQLNGEFSFALFDRRSRHLILATDRMGDRRLFYTKSARTLLFASQIQTLLAHPRVSARLDEHGLADHVLNGHDDGHRTCFDGIFGVPPGHQVVASEAGISISRHWDFDPVEDVRYRSPSDYVEAFRALFQQSVRRRILGARSIAVSVSGGLDSSAVFCQAEVESRHSSPPASLIGVSSTFPEGSPSDEQTFLEEIEKEGRVRIERFPVNQLSHLADSQRLARLSGFPATIWDSTTSLYRHAKHLGCASIMDGVFADQILFPDTYLVDLAKGMRWGAVARHLRGFAAWNSDVPRQVFRQQFQSAFLRAAVPRPLFRLARTLRNRSRPHRIYPRWYTNRMIQHALDLTLNRADAEPGFRSHQGKRYHAIASSGVYSRTIQDRRAAGALTGIEVLHPFRDRDLMAFLMAIPGEIVNLEGVPKGLLREAMRNVMPESIRTRKSKADFTAISNQAVAADYPFIAGLFGGDSCAINAGVVDGHVVRDELAVFGRRLGASDNALASRRMIELASLELWMREFFGIGSAANVTHCERSTRKSG